MSRIIALIFLAACAAPPHSALAVTIPTVLVGNAGNAADQTVYPLGNPDKILFGSVPYTYRIGSTEVTNAQYAAFLNAKAASDPLALYSANMGSDIRGGIIRSGASGSFTYATKTNMGDKPVNFVNWYDAIRFANWLNNGQGAGDTETGAYTLLGGTLIPSNGLSITRNSGATWFLPSEDEWYKAAYHQPALQGGDSDDYWQFATASNTVPTIATADSIGNINNPSDNVANWSNGADWNAKNGNVTTVATAGLLSESFYGTSDQDGNVWEWNEAIISGEFLGTSALFRGLRGGSWSQNMVGASFRLNDNPGNGPEYYGFRVAALALVPEPSTIGLSALSLGSLIACTWRQRRR